MKKTGCGYNEIIKAINMIAAAEKGELFGKDKKWKPGIYVLV